MSKKNKRRRQRKTFPWPLVASGGILLIIAAFFVFSNGDSGGTPIITVDQPAIDYGYVQFGNNKSFAIKVTNTGEGTLRIKEKPYVEVLEGC